MSWTCPHCGRTFARTAQTHVCGTWTVDEHLEGADPRALDLFEGFVAVLESCGPFDFAPTRRQIGLRGPRRIFAGVRLTGRGLEGYLDLPRHVDSPRFRHVSSYTRELSVHHFVLERPDQLDEEFASWIREAHAVGQAREAAPAPAGERRQQVPGR
jgi:hypothetical protein